jgi:hypothetical protein
MPTERYANNASSVLTAALTASSGDTAVVVAPLIDLDRRGTGLVSWPALCPRRSIGGVAPKLACLRHCSRLISSQPAS